MTRKYTFKKEGLTCLIWSKCPEISSDMVSGGWELVTVEEILNKQ